jgi:hypothetical protein
VFDALSALRSQSEKAVGLKASGQCRFEYYADGKRHKENLGVRMWVNPPDEIYVRCDASVVPKAVVVGSNAEEFWLAVRPKEVSTYWWGRWSEQGSVGKVKINPRVVLEGFGAVDVDDRQDWSLSVEGPFDVLTRRGADGAVIKKVYVYKCDYHVANIEYYDQEERAAVVAELRNYREASEGFWVPTVITIIDRSDVEQPDSMRIVLRSVTQKDFSEKDRGVIFRRPAPRGFEHVFRVVDGKLFAEEK